MTRVLAMCLLIVAAAVAQVPPRAATKCGHAVQRRADRAYLMRNQLARAPFGCSRSFTLSEPYYAKLGAQGVEVWRRDISDQPLALLDVERVGPAAGSAPPPPPPTAPTACATKPTIVRDYWTREAGHLVHVLDTTTTEEHP